MAELGGTCALVTGATSGLGLAMARALVGRRRARSHHESSGAAVEALSRVMAADLAGCA